MILLYTILFILVKGVLCQKPSPCPEIFLYERSENNNQWYGTIFVRTVENLTEIEVQVIVDTPAESFGVLGNWTGHVLYPDNTVFIIRNKKIEYGFYPPVRFFVKFDSNRTIPSVKTIKMNKNTICPTDLTKEIVYIRASTTDTPKTTPLPDRNIWRTSSPVQKRNMEFSTLYSPIRNVENNTGTDKRNGSGIHLLPQTLNINDSTLSTRTINSDITTTTGKGTDQGKDNLKRQKSSTETTLNPSRTDLQVNFYDEEMDDLESDFPFGDFTWQIMSPPKNEPKVPNCGTIVTRSTQLPTNGDETWPGQWPWHAALYRSYVNSIQRSVVYICGATLISEQYVIAPAHYVYSKRGVQPNDFLVSLGKFNLSGYGPNIQDRSVVEIVIHPKYNHSVYLNDVAVLKLSSPITITDYVRPCCLWEGDSNINDIIGKEGIMVGWNEKNRKLMQTKIPIVERQNCVSITKTNSNYCAGFKNGTAACAGKSIGGMFFPRQESRGQGTIWQIRGILPSEVGQKNQCDKSGSEYIVFTDLANYSEWITKVVSRK